MKELDNKTAACSAWGLCYSCVLTSVQHKDLCRPTQKWSKVKIVSDCGMGGGGKDLFEKALDAALKEGMLREEAVRWTGQKAWW